MKESCLSIISNWLRTYTFNKVRLGDDILTFFALYLDYKMYKSSFSPLYAGKGIKFYNYKDSIPATHISGYGVARMVDPLQHGTITEFTVSSGAPLVGVMSGNSKCYEKIGADGNIYNFKFTRDCYNIFGFYGMSYGYGEEQCYAGNYRMSSNKYGFICCGSMDYSFNTEKKNEWVVGSGMQHKSGSFIPFERWSGPIWSEIVVRVNLVDYVVSFWEKSSGNFIALKEGFYKSTASVRGDRWYSYTSGVTDVNYVHCPVVLELPSDPNVQWFPAVFLTEVWKSSGCTYSINDTKSVSFHFEEDSE